MSRTKFVVATTVAALALGVTPANAGTQGDTEACTPGYWKNHTDAWLENPDASPLASDTTFDELSAAYGLAEMPGDYGDVTLMEALTATGKDPGMKLLKHAAAAFLNSFVEIEYPLTRFEIFEDTAAALESGDRATMLDLKDEYDAIANDLECTLN